LLGEKGSLDVQDPQGREFLKKVSGKEDKRSTKTTRQEKTRGEGANQ